ncbi:MAG: hypothetical protein HWN66_13310 [Candidatus Helarchaeota archaeon]|nr:hypothetical protein [Candidatus Helarchaeota archaeon]
MNSNTELIALALKLIKILIYLFFQALFLRRVSRKWRQAEPVTLEFCTFAFFFCMMIGSVSEIIWMAEQPIYYESEGASLIYFIGFIALTFLSLGIERSAKLKTKGLIAIIPFSMAVATFFVDITTPPYFFIALIVGIIPALFLYQGYISEGLIRKQFIYIGVGYFLVFAGEAVNYNIIRTHLTWLDALFINLTGTSGEYFPPILILLGLLCLFNGYVIIARKLTF